MNGRNCLRRISVQTLQEYRVDFWSSKPNPRQRREKIVQHLQRARDNFRTRKSVGLNCEGCRNDLCFMVDDNIVCEKAYTFMIAMQHDESGKKNKVWTEEMQTFVTGSQVLFFS